MKIPFLKRKKKGEPNHIHVKGKKVEAVTPDQKRIKRELAYKERLENSSEKRRSYKHG